ncbi:MAG: hypothetical protein ACT4PE_16335 [Candidatus Eiseniibacteriota bacterium]
MGKTCEHPLHGITVVVDTGGPRIYVGRYHSETEQGVLLHDADVRDVGTPEQKAVYLARSARLGVFKNTERVVVPRDEVRSLKRLIEYAAESAP